jgi:adenosine deaminase
LSSPLITVCTDRGYFNPEFYPRRFIMKDPIVDAFPEVLAILVNSACFRYGKAGVSYVEFSVSCGDLITEEKFDALNKKTFSDPLVPLPVNKKRSAMVASERKTKAVRLDVGEDIARAARSLLPSALGSSAALSAFALAGAGATVLVPGANVISPTGTSVASTTAPPSSRPSMTFSEGGDAAVGSGVETTPMTFDAPGAETIPAEPVLQVPATMPAPLQDKKSLTWHKHVDHMDRPRNQKVTFLAAFNRDQSVVYHGVNKEGSLEVAEKPGSHTGAYEQLGNMARDVPAIVAALGTDLGAEVLLPDELQWLHGNVQHVEQLCEGPAPICRYLRALAQILCRDDSIGVMYPNLITANSRVEQLRKKMESAASRRKYVQMVAGLDWVGDELGHPFCIFSHDNYVSLVADWMQHNAYFGVRFHAGEGPIRPSTRHGATSDLRLAFYLHMYILSEGIMLYHRKLTAKLLEMGRADLKPRIRIGHGVAFLWGSDNEKSEHWFDIHMKEFRGFLRENEIVCELSPTSNHMLLPSTFHNRERTTNKRTLRSFLDAELPVVLSTDDDGIWAIHKCKCHHRHISVAAEYCRAIECGDIQSKDELEEMLYWGRHSAFCGPSTKEAAVPTRVEERRKK